MNKPKLTLEQKRRLIAWCEDLESGKYKQTREELRSGGNGFCCLGVACEVYSRQTGDGGWDDDDNFVVGEDDRNSDLPHAVAAWFGIECNPVLIDTPYQPNITAAAWNDDYGRNFKEIAALIRKTYYLPPQTEGELK